MMMMMMMSPEGKRLLRAASNVYHSRKQGRSRRRRKTCSRGFLQHVYRCFSYGEIEDYSEMSPKGKRLLRAASDVYYSRKQGRSDSSSEEDPNGSSDSSTKTRPS
ncbi:hypothetical protein RJT34_07620 [Clitoria ternatea]|uniref:Uncharacterized protein n=1 Tax=Clitoria ternatea TaxID=43366 RepID=A0AAN9PUY5_CLITE